MAPRRLDAHYSTGKAWEEGPHILRDRKLKRALRPLVHKIRRIPGHLVMRLGRINRLAPLSTSFGFDRGTPVDRIYIERFLEDHAGDIRGTVLEVVDAGYSKRFGGRQVTSQHVVDLDAENPQATIIGDLTDPLVLPSGAFDCVILTQTLHIIYDMDAALQQIHRSLRTGGVALITVPGITPVRPGENHGWYWSLTEAALRRLLAEYFRPEDISVSTFGNLFAATAFLHGAAVEEIPRRMLEPLDPAYPVVVAARAVA